jgi:glycosyltransferase involved in cell wall biosynthesis
MFMDSSNKLKLIRVCFIAPKAYPLFNPDAKKVFGGAEVDLYFLATELAKDESFSASFITADYGQENFETINNVRIIKSVDFNKNPLSGAARVWRAMHAADAQIYFHEAPSWGTFLIALFCKLNKRVFIYRTASRRESDGTFFRQKPFAGRAFRWSLRSAAQVIVQNQTDKENLTRTTGISSIVIPNAHHLPSSPEVKRDIILWVGRSVSIKRPELFIKLARHTPDEKFTMICQEATGDKNYRDLLAEADKIDNLQFIEEVPFAEITSYFQRAKVFVNTSDSEGFPNTFIHACNCTVPILSLNVNPDGFINTYNCGICCDGDWLQMVDSLKVILKDDRRLEMGSNGKKYVTEHHDVTRIINRYKELFKQLVNRRRAQADE